MMEYGAWAHPKIWVWCMGEDREISEIVGEFDWDLMGELRADLLEDPELVPSLPYSDDPSPLTQRLCQLDYDSGDSGPGGYSPGYDLTVTEETR